MTTNKKFFNRSLTVKKYFHFSHGQSLYNFSMFTYQNSYSTEFINNDNLKWPIIFLRLWTFIHDMTALSLGGVPKQLVALWK